MGFSVQGGGEVFFCFSSCVFLVGLNVILGRSLALRGGNLKNKKSWRGVGGDVSCFYSFGEPLTDGLTQCLCIDRTLLYS